MRDQNRFNREQHQPMLVGQVIEHFGNYDLVRRIAAGGMGEVYLARQRTAFGREVAVKIIRSDLVHDMTARKRFLREAEVNAYLKHDHILPLVEFGEEQGRLFLVTPYIKGGTLLNRLQAGPLPLSEVHQLFIALVEAVAYLHKRGVVHRDLKPSNILLDCAEDSDRVYVRLIDFGIAALQGLSASAPLTMAGHEVGTVAYMAPERLDGVAAPSNDIYSLGIILYQMITGQLPKAGEMVSLPGPLEYVIGHCITANPNERFTNADQLSTSFEQAYHVVKNSCDVSKPLVAATGSTVSPSVESAISRSTPTPPTRDFTASPSPDSATIVRLGKSTTQQESLPPSDLLKKAALESSGRVVTPRSEVILPPLSGKGETFKDEDYDAPTSYFELGSLQERKATSPKKPLGSSSKSHKRNLPLITIITTLIMIILLIMGGLGYQAFQAAISANITISPRVQTISTIFTLVGKPGLKRTDAASSSIPVGFLTSTQTSSQERETTGQTGCIRGPFMIDPLNLPCKQSVSPLDIERLSSQVQQTVHSKIDQDLQKQARSMNAIIVGKPIYSTKDIQSDQGIGTPSKTVTVTITEQGSVEYIKVKDVQDLALLLLKRKLNQNYALIDSSTQIGQPVVQLVNSDGTVQVAIAAGGIAHYQIPASELADIQNRTKGLTRKDARAQITKHGDIDPNAISIHISHGDTIPNNVQQIKIDITNPTNLPTVKLTPLSSP